MQILISYSVRISGEKGKSESVYPRIYGHVRTKPAHNGPAISGIRTHDLPTHWNTRSIAQRANRLHKCSDEYRVIRFYNLHCLLSGSNNEVPFWARYMYMYFTPTKLLPGFHGYNRKHSGNPERSNYCDGGDTCVHINMFYIQLWEWANMFIMLFSIGWL